MSHRRYAVYYAIVHIIAVALGGGFLMLDSFGVLDGIVYCPIHFFLHLYCPACGGTRAVWLLFSGNPLASLRYNPTALFLVLSLLYYEAAALRSLITRRLEYIRGVRFLPLYITVGVCLSYCIIRNLLLVNGIYDGIGELLPYWK